MKQYEIKRRISGEELRSAAIKIQAHVEQDLERRLGVALAKEAFVTHEELDGLTGDTTICKRVYTLNEEEWKALTHFLQCYRYSNLPGNEGVFDYAAYHLGEVLERNS